MPRFQKARGLSCHLWHDQASFPRIDQRQAQSLRCEAPPLRNWLGLLQRRNSQCRASLPVTSSSRVRGGCERDLLTVMRPSVPVPESSGTHRAPAVPPGSGVRGRSAQRRLRAPSLPICEPASRPFRRSAAPCPIWATAPHPPRRRSRRFPVGRTNGDEAGIAPEAAAELGKANRDKAPGFGDLSRFATPSACA